MAKGDHLAVYCGAYSHHAVDLGDGRVVQFGSGIGGRTNPRIEVVGKSVFAQGNRPRLVNTPTIYRSDEIVERALSRLGEQEYSLLSNNCEHFVNWCRTGHAESRQVNRVVERTASAVTKLASKSAAKGLSRIAAKSGTKVAAKAMARAATPLLLVADLVQLTTDVAASKLRSNEEDAERTGQMAGMVTSVGIGATTAGPLGALAGFGLWAFGEAVGKSLIQSALLWPCPRN